LIKTGRLIKKGLKPKVLGLIFCVLVSFLYSNPASSNDLINNLFVNKNLNRYGRPFSPMRFNAPTTAFPTVNSNPTKLTQSSLPFQGMGPYNMVVTNDGQFAYISFYAPQSVFKIRLADLTIEGMTDLTAYFPFNENQPIALDSTERHLFVSTSSHKKLHVIDTETMNIIHTINDIPISGLIRSLHGPFLIGLSMASSIIKFINTETYEVTEVTYGDLGFYYIQESKTDPAIWYIVALSGGTDFEVGRYNHETKTWVYKASYPIALGYPRDMKVIPNEQKVYVAILGGWYPEFHAYGSLFIVDLIEENSKTIPIDGGAFCLEASVSNRYLYVGTAWPLPNNNNILVVDTQTNDIVGSVLIKPQKYGAPYTQMNDLQLVPSNPNILYASSGDANALIKVKLETLTGMDVLVFNEASYMPRNFVHYPGKSIGYPVTNVPYLFEFNKATANIDKVCRLPPIRDGRGWDMKITNDENAYISQGEYFLKMDMNNTTATLTF
jgi:DNA-binding beta-propeller fold protein YncE